MTTSTFTVIDVETATETGRIRQIGAVRYVGSRISDRYAIQVDSEGAEDGGSFGDIAPEIYKFLHDTVVVVYGIEPRLAIEEAFRDIGWEAPNAMWVDCKRVAISAWPHCGFEIKLAEVCELIGCSYSPRDPLEGARAVGQVFLAALRDSGF